HGEVDGKRIDRLVVHAELVVQVRPGGPAGGTDVADVVALADLHALLDALGKALLVGIEGSDVVVVFDDDGVAVTVLPPRELDDAVGRCVDGGAAGGSVIDPGVLAPAAMDRMAAPAEGGTDARELERIAQECALQAATIEIVVRARTRFRRKPDGVVGL